MVHIPITGAAFDSEPSPVASSAVTATDKVRFAWAFSKKYPTSPYPLSEPTQSPAGGTSAGALQVFVAAHDGTACELPDIRMS